MNKPYPVFDFHSKKHRLIELLLHDLDKKKTELFSRCNSKDLESQGH